MSTAATSGYVGVSRRSAMATNQPLMSGNDHFYPTRPRTMESSLGQQTRLVSGQKSTPGISSELRRSSSKNASSMRKTESALKGLANLTLRQ